MFAWDTLKWAATLFDFFPACSRSMACSSDMTTLGDILRCKFYKPARKQIPCQILSRFFKTSVLSELLFRQIMSHLDRLVIHHWKKYRMSCCTQVKRTGEQLTCSAEHKKESCIAIHAYLWRDHWNMGPLYAFLFWKYISYIYYQSQLFFIKIFVILSLNLL